MPEATIDPKAYEDIVVGVATKKVRNPDWRCDAKQEAWAGIIRAAQRGPVPPKLAVTITINACYDVLRRHKHDPVNAGLVIEHTESRGEETRFKADLGHYVSLQTPEHQRVLRYVLSFGPYEDLQHLGRMTRTSRATASRALTALADYLKGVR